MAMYKIAQLSHGGRDLIVTLVEADFGQKSLQEQQQKTLKLQNCAKSAGLPGRVIPVWDEGESRVNFFAPPYLSNYFSSMEISYLTKRLKDELECE